MKSIPSFAGSKLTFLKLGSASAGLVGVFGLVFESQILGFSV